MGIAIERSTASSAPRPSGPWEGEAESDSELVDRCQAGDQSAFAELYRRHERPLCRFCLRRLHRPEDAEEATQEAFTKAWSALPRFGGERRFYPWLTVIAANVCADMLRRQSRLLPLPETRLDRPDRAHAGADEQVLLRADQKVVREAFTHLSDRHQRILRLREESGWSSERIAAHEGVGVPAVDSLAWRARHALRREFASIWQSGGRLIGIVGVGVSSLRQACRRFAMQLSSRSSSITRSVFQWRGRGTIAWAAVTVAAVGGGLTLVGSHHSRSVQATTVSGLSSSISADGASCANCTPSGLPASGGAEWQDVPSAAGSEASGTSTDRDPGVTAPLPSAGIARPTRADATAEAAPAEGAEGESGTAHDVTTGLISSVTGAVTRVVQTVTRAVTSVAQSVAGATTTAGQVAAGAMSGAAGTVGAVVAGATGAVGSSVTTALGGDGEGTSSSSSSSGTHAIRLPSETGGLLAGLGSTVGGTTGLRG